MKCLLVDDEPGIREGLAALLRRKGHDVHTAADCAGARAALADDFDVVVTDWHLPDGLAASFVADVRCPVIAVSGHPEEIDGLPGLREVMTKPVMPSRLLAAIAATATDPLPVDEDRPLPIDVQSAVDTFLQQLPADAIVERADDATFVEVRAELPSAVRPPVAVRDGELAWATVAGRARASLRLHRDGRPGRPMPIVAAGAEWPSAAEFAVDFHATRLGGPQFVACIAAASRTTAAGGRVHFLNVPGALRAFAESHGNAHDMPMRDAVGPRLSADLADLWRDP
jgi:CheY-like chemotaxis protein